MYRRAGVKLHHGWTPNAPTARLCCTDKQDEKVLPDRRAFPRRRACLTERAPADRGDFDAEPIARIEPHRRARPREPRAQVAQVPGENLNSGIFGSLPEPKTQAARRLRS